MKGPKSNKNNYLKRDGRNKPPLIFVWPGQNTNEGSPHMLKYLNYLKANC